MTRSKRSTENPDWNALLRDDADLMREIVRAAVTEILEGSVIRSDGYRCALGVESAARGSTSSSRDTLEGLQTAASPTSSSASPTPTRARRTPSPRYSAVPGSAHLLAVALDSMMSSGCPPRRERALAA
jgi:hypothetical protein